MVTRVDTGVHVLVVTGPACELLFAHFTRLYLGRDDVKVVKDRRVVERRHDLLAVESERRRDECRRSSGWLFPEPGSPAAAE